MIARFALLPVQFLGLCALLYASAGWLIVPPSVILGVF